MRLQERNSNEKALILFPALAFAVALAVIVGNRLSNEAIAVVVGAVCGISASIPVTIALVIAASKNWGREPEPREVEYDYGAYRYTPQLPPILLVSPPLSQQQGQHYLPPDMTMTEPGASREFTREHLHLHLRLRLHLRLSQTQVSHTALAGRQCQGMQV